LAGKQQQQHSALRAEVMTGIADAILYLKRPYSKDRRKRLLAHFLRPSPQTRFVVLSWKRTGSNLLCGILYNHPEIIMHNELFNPIDIFTYYPKYLNPPIEESQPPRWTPLIRDLFPNDFLEFIWSGKKCGGNEPIRPSFKAVGFKSFPEHWIDVRNEHIFQDAILEDLRVKKVILCRKDELAVYVSMLRADETGRYMTHNYPENLKFNIDPAEFQSFLDRYRHTFHHKYKSPIVQRDTFWIYYEDLCDLEYFRMNIYPHLCNFLGISKCPNIKTLRETVKQSDPEEDLSMIIENYEELEYCFRHSDVTHFAKLRDQGVKKVISTHERNKKPIEELHLDREDATWSILLPICSRTISPQVESRHCHSVDQETTFNTNRFSELTQSSQYNGSFNESCWDLLLGFCKSLGETVPPTQLENFECIVGIDVDDIVYQPARERLSAMIPCKVVFVDIQPIMYGKLCRIWNHLASKSSNDYIVLFGDDVRLLDYGWPQKIQECFGKISKITGLPLGAACVAMNDLSFPGFPTFPVVHRWHLNHFDTLLPKQFVNQGGDPFLYELYSRFEASAWEVSCRLENTIGGDGNARYQKYHINWRGHILNMNIKKLQKSVNIHPGGVCLDVVVPSYRTNNDDYLRRIASLRASRGGVYVKFWFVVDNPCKDHVNAVKQLSKELNTKQLYDDGNFFINVIHYGANRGASYARNTGYNYSTADWILFLDDDVIPDENILDAYIGAIKRFPGAKVLAGLTTLPEATNTWTTMLRVCNVGYFYGISKLRRHPPWAVTANLLVRGSRFNPTIQFKECYPKTGGGEDIDFVYQYKNFYQSSGIFVTAAVPEAEVRHPWWNGGYLCYQQIRGWAHGDSMCILEWPSKTFLCLPNWIEHVTFIVLPLALYTRQHVAGLLVGSCVVVLEHLIKLGRYLPTAVKECEDNNIFYSLFVALGAGSILSAQEITRVKAIVQRFSLYSICRRVDWFDGQEPRIKLDIQFGSIIRFVLNVGITCVGFGSYWRKKSND
jgi:glycosyltransferase involved in cell wall biosynthesis